MIHGTPIDVKIPIEDVEPTAILDFPFYLVGNPADIVAMKNAIMEILRDVNVIKSDQADIANAGEAYDIAVFALESAEKAYTILR